MTCRSLALLLAGMVVSSDLAAQVSQGGGDPWTGTFSNSQLTLTLRRQGAGYEGTAEVNGQSFPVTAQADGAGLAGSYRDTDGTTYGLSLTRNGDGVTLVVDGVTVQLARVSGAQPRQVQPGAADRQPEANSQLAQQWQNHLAGNMAARYSRYSSGSDGGYSSSTEFHLCRNGQFLVKRSSSVSVDIGGASGYSGGNSDDRGTWRIITQGNQAGIELRYANGEVIQARLDYEDGKTLVDGERWLIGRSGICQ